MPLGSVYYVGEILTSIVPKPEALLLVETYFSRWRRMSTAILSGVVGVPCLSNILENAAVN